MPTTNGNRKILDLKRWEMCNPLPGALSAGCLFVSSRQRRQQQLIMYSATNAFIFNPNEDGSIVVPSPALAGTFGAGTCGVAAAFSTGATAGVSFLTATAGSTTGITTNQNLQRDLRGYSVQFVGGANSGKVKEIASNTIGASAVITFVGAEAVAFDATSQYRLLTPNWFVLNAGTPAAGSFKRYDFATNTWVSLAITGLPGSIATDGRLVSTPSYLGESFKSFATGTATAGGANTLTNSAKTWAVNQWANAYQARITAGLGIGQIRPVASNTGTALTVSSNWTTAPDATSVYSIEGNDDFIYFLGSNAVTMYRYSISANTWTTLSPGVARAGAPGVGMSGHWIYSVSSADWNNESTIRNGRYLYSFRGNGAANLDRYDIALNTWEAVAYSPSTETFTTGTKYTYLKDRLYIQKEATGRWFAFDFVQSAMEPWGTMVYPQGAAILGDTAFDVTYKDGETEIDYVYMGLNTSSVLLRQMVI